MLDSTQSQLKSLLLEKYDDVFRDELGTMNSIRAELRVKDDALPRFYPPCPAMKEAIEREIHWLEEADAVSKRFREVSHD